MRTVADDNVGIRDAFLCTCPVAIGLDRHEDAFRPSCGECAAALWAAVVHVDDHLHHLGIHLAKRRVNPRVQGVGEAPLAKNLRDEVVMLFLAVVHGAGDLACLPMLRIKCFPFRHQLQNVLLWHALDRHCRAWLRELLGEFHAEVCHLSCHLLVELAPHLGQLPDRRCERLDHVCLQALSGGDAPQAQQELEQRGPEDGRAQDSVRILATEGVVHQGPKGLLECEDHCCDASYK
mmetsp:Transcript_145206/g.362193  ORF Transcript_145206/g.362193 Transcript_145206/m.362193 type:complete len:235 (+) Transcript_145206:954-1658(+)